MEGQTLLGYIIQILQVIAVPVTALITGILVSRTARFSSKAEDRRQNRNQQTVALEKLYDLLEDQSDALRDYWGLLRNPAIESDLHLSLKEAWHILHDKRYGAKLWAVQNSDIVPSINRYAETMDSLLKDFRELRDQPSREKVDRAIQKCDEARKHLAEVKIRVIRRLSVINGIYDDSD